MSSLTLVDAFRHAVELRGQGKLAEAGAICRQILAVDDRQPDTLHLLGVICHQTGQGESAQQLIQHAIALSPDNAEFRNNLGEVWRAAARWEEATAGYQAAIRLRPTFSTAHNNLGVVLLHQGRFAEAETRFREAVRLRPDYADAYFNLGQACHHLDQIDAAVAAFQTGIRLRPDLLEAYMSLGALQLSAGRVEAAKATLRAALTVKPDSSGVLCNLGNVYKDEGDLDQAMECYRQSLRCDPTNAVAASNLAYTAWFHPGYGEAQIIEEHRRWQQHQAAPQARFVRSHANGRDPARRIRVGYVSPFFSSHVVGWNLLPLFRGHDRAQFEIHCYSDVMHPDAVTAEIRQLACRWCSCLNWPVDALAAQIEQDEIDILVDLNLHMARNRLLVFARQPAPIQLTFAGYPGTTGLHTMQYRLTDEWLDPAANPAPYVEASLRLKSFWCYLPRGDEPEIVAPPVVASGRITFGCLNNFCKVSAAMLALWAQVLRATPDSRLVLLAAPGGHRARTLDHLGRHGVAADRVTFIQQRTHADYMATYQQIDLVLDTFPYNGHTTSCDALWMGVPVVTLAGETVVSRAGVSQLSNLGLPELIARSAPEFVSLATALAADPARLAMLRATLRSRMRQSPLMDAASFTRGIEAAYRQIWQRWCLAVPLSPCPT